VTVTVTGALLIRDLLLEKCASSRHPTAATPVAVRDHRVVDGNGVKAGL
jgi:hypothetical protein